MSDRLITKTEELEAFCRVAASAPYITIDTEFLRERTYYAKLCLIQIGLPEQEGREDIQVAIDPLSADLNLATLEAVLFNPDILKVFHAAKQDLEIMAYHFDGRVPAPLFDTQIAAMVCGYGDQIGYQNLVKQICKIELDKSNQYTDWSRRPLSPDQIDYALGDVTHLRVIYRHLHKKLEQTGRTHWVSEEVKSLQDPESYVVHPEDIWQRVKIRTDKPKSLAVLRALAEWREREAMSRDMPRNFILRDEIVGELAKQIPLKSKDFQKIRGLPEKYQKEKGIELLLGIIEGALKTPKSSWPQKPERLIIPPGLTAAQEMLRLLLKMQAASYGVVPRIIASNDDIDLYLLKNDEDAAENKIMRGWRHEVFGQYAADLIAGNLCLRLQEGQIKIEKI